MHPDARKVIISCASIACMTQIRTVSLLAHSMRSVLLTVLACLLPVAAGALECSEVMFRDVRSTVCRVDIRSDRLQLFLADPSGRPFNTFRKVAESVSARNEQLVFAMNAG